MTAAATRQDTLDSLWDEGWELLEERAPIPAGQWIEENCVVVDGPKPGPFRFRDGFTWQREIVDVLGAPQPPGSGTREGWVKKCCQSGLTVLFTALMLYRLLVLRYPTILLEPRDSDANRVAADADRMIVGSPKLRDQFPGRDARKMRWTRAGTKGYFRYSNSQDELVSISAQGYFADEFDRVYRGEDYSAPDMLAKRLDAWAEKLKAHISTPTYPGGGIDEGFEASKKGRWNVVCPYCDEAQVPEFETNISWDHDQPSLKLQAKTAWMHCAHCKHRWSRFDRERADNTGFWVYEHPERAAWGWELNACHIVARDPVDLVEDDLKGQLSELARKEDLNQNKARTYLPKGAKLPEAMLKAVIDDDLKWGVPPPGTQRLVFGSDVQKAAEPLDFPWEVRAYDQAGMCSLIAYGIASGRSEVKEVLGRSWQGRHIDCGLMDQGDGAHHSTVVRELVAEVPILMSAIFDHHMKESEKLSKPSKEVAELRRVHRELALTETMGRFVPGESTTTIRVARNPDWAAEQAWMKHYQKLHRKAKKTADGLGYTWEKQDQMGVDFPFAGALCEVARTLHPHGGGSGKGWGNLDSETNKARRARDRDDKPKGGWGAIPRKGRGGGGWRRT